MIFAIKTTQHMPSYAMPTDDNDTDGGIGGGVW